jgi:hypothetical protein
MMARVFLANSSRDELTSQQNSRARRQNSRARRRTQGRERQALEEQTHLDPLAAGVESRMKT